MISNHLLAKLDSPSSHPLGLTYQPHFLDPAIQNDLLAVIDTQVWSQELKRRVQHYGFRYDYRARQVDRIMHLIINEYLPGQGISAHIDCEPCFDDCIVSISLGWAYEMEFQHAATTSTSTLMLAPGSLLVLSGLARYEWTHQIRPRLKDHGVSRRRRVSLTFRKVLLGEPVAR